MIFAIIIYLILSALTITGYILAAEAWKRR